MDLIYTDESRNDIGVLNGYSLDMAYGSGENDFSLTVANDNNVCRAGHYIYVERKEYGGIIDKLNINTSSGHLSYIGRTWHGVLNSKVIRPNDGEAYYRVSGEANQILNMLIRRLSLESLFVASEKDSGIQIEYQFERYTEGYDGIAKMLESVDAKLAISFINGYVELSAEPKTYYSNEDEIDTDQINFDIEKNYHPVNHLVCLGRGELQDRLVVDLYCDANRNISRRQTFFGMEENTAVYDYSSAEDEDELIRGGKQRLLELTDESLKVIFPENYEEMSIGDVVKAHEFITGLKVESTIKKKIVRVNNGIWKIDYKVGE